MMMRPPRLDVVVVNWNSGGQLRACLDSVARSDRTGLVLERIVVVDNASTDGSADDLPEAGGRIVLRRNGTNRGFAAACNQGASGSAAEYLLFLNPDVLLGADSLTRSIAFMEQASQVGVCGIQLVDALGRVTRSCGRFPTPLRILARIFGLDRGRSVRFAGLRMTEWDHRDSRQVDQVIGAFFLVRRSLFEALDGFDERFFVYFEEVDFSCRARARGWSSYFLADAQAFHRENGTTDQIKALRLFYSLQSRIKYGQKHFGRRASFGLAVATLTVEPITRLLFTFWTRPPREVGEVIEGYAKLWAMAPRLLFGDGRQGGPPCVSSC